MTDHDHEHQARAALTYLAEPIDPRMSALIRTCGAPQAFDIIRACLIPPSALVGAFGTTADDHAAAARSLTRWRSRLPELGTAPGLDRFARDGIRFICPCDPEWPQQFADLGDAEPIALWIRGAADLRTCTERSVAVVGSRAATAYGSHVAAEIASGLGTEGWTVVSGAAYGIDAAAHRGALGTDGVTVAVLASGVDRPYPAGHAQILDVISEHGAVVTEQPPGRHVTRTRLLARNRIIAALATATVIVEAGTRSGTLNTARHAITLGRRVMAVPGPVTSEQSTGPNRLIGAGQAQLVTSAGDILTDLNATP